MQNRLQEGMSGTGRTAVCNSLVLLPMLHWDWAGASFAWQIIPGSCNALNYLRVKPPEQRKCLPNPSQHD